MVSSYIGESNLEKCLIEQLESQGYAYRNDIKDICQIEQNFKKHIEINNNIQLSAQEFDRILKDLVKADPFECAEILREDRINFKRDDDTSCNIMIYNNKEWCRNQFEVVHQIKNPTQHDNPNHRYDVILLINGIPMVHIELKASKVSPQQALKQINYYKNTPQDLSLLCFVQIYIISNNTLTYYCVNNHKKFFEIDEKKDLIPFFEWKDSENKVLNDLLTDFAPSFLEKCFLSKMISRYIANIQTKRQLMILRPYQVHAVEKIISQVNSSSTTNGYIWHTTGSGKTLTSFKTAMILRDQEDIDKIIFVVDRKDLDKQTIEEFNRYEDKCVDLTVDSRALRKKLLDPMQKVVVTTIQKMSRLLTKPDELKSIKDKRVIFIFDECHRSQFGEYNKLIRESFNNRQMFGFTGTPIFAENSKKMIVENNQNQKIQTKHIFDEKLHSYLISNAIEDKNVLKFHIEYYQCEKNIDFKSREWKEIVAQKIIDTHEKATVSRQYNAIFATASISDAIEYYELFQSLQKDSTKPLRVACIFSPPPSMDLGNLHEDLDDENKEYKNDASTYKKDALVKIIQNYNKLFHVDFSLKGTNETNGFMGYYNDISYRVKNHYELRTNKKINESIDILIVVDMFLTGFDSKFINTLYVDKNLEYHGLIQAYSRTNRIHNANKPHGNIYNFRPLKNAVDEAIQLFSTAEQHDVDVWIVKSYAEVRTDLKTEIETLENIFKQENYDLKPSNVPKLSYENKREFLQQFPQVVKLMKSLDQYIFEETKDLEEIYPKDEFNAMTRMFLELKNQMSENAPIDSQSDKIELLDEDIELELFHTDIIDLDYIKQLTLDFVAEKSNADRDAFLQDIARTLEGSRQVKWINEFMDYCQQNNLFGASSKQVQDEFESFKQDVELRAWKQLCDEENLDFDKVWAVRDSYLKKRRIDDDLLDNLIAKELVLFQRIERRRELSNKIELVLKEYLWDDED